MNIEDIFKQQAANDVITSLKGGRMTEQPDTDKAEKSLNIDKHKVNDAIARPDKVVEIGADDDEYADSGHVNDMPDGYLGGKKETATRIEKVARIALSLQKLIIKRSVAFLFGNPVSYYVDTENDKQEVIMKALNRILNDVKSNSLNRKVARATFGYNECAELWYAVEKDHTTYGFKSKFKLRCNLISPAFGDTLYPYFDATGDMIAFSREFARKTKDAEIRYFETYTDKQIFLWVSDGSGWRLQEGYPKVNAFEKIPIVYAYQEDRETEDVDMLIERLEFLLSNFADTNDYHASPKIFVQGKVLGFSKKGESGAVIEGEEGSTAQYLSWANAPESVKLEIETLLRMIYTITQTPDISFESVKGLSAISGVALKLLFMDAHLKVHDKLEIFDEYLQRRVNILKAFIGKADLSLAKECDNMTIEPEVIPYTLTNEIDELNYWMTANGNKPVIDQEGSIEKAGLSNNPKQTYERLQAESEKEMSFATGEATY